MTKTPLFIQLETSEHVAFKAAISTHNSKPLAKKDSMRSVIRDAIAKYIKKNK